MRQRKLNLIPVHQLAVTAKADSEYRATYYAGSGKLSFSQAYGRDYGMDGAFLRFFADNEKKVLAWQKILGNDLISKEGKVCQAKKYAKTVLVTIPKKVRVPLADSLKIDQEGKFMGMPVLSYVDSILGKVDYIELTHSSADKVEEN